MDLLWRHVGRAEEFEQLGSIVETRIIVLTYIIYIGQLEHVVGAVVCVIYGNFVFCLKLCKVFVIVDKHRLDRSDVAVLYLLKKIARHIAVHGDRRDFGFGDLELIGVWPLKLIDSGIVVVSEVFVGDGHDICFCDLVEIFIRFHDIAPGFAVDESLDIVVGTGFIALEGALELKFGVIDDCRHEIVVEVAFAKFFHFGQ